MPEALEAHDWPLRKEDNTARRARQEGECEAREMSRDREPTIAERLDAILGRSGSSRCPALELLCGRWYAVTVAADCEPTSDHDGACTIAADFQPTPDHDGAFNRAWREPGTPDVVSDRLDTTEAYVEQLFLRGIIVGFDGSSLEDGEYVFVVNPRDWNENGYLALRKIDYWHGVVGDQPVCQMYEDETNYAADELISPCHGFTAQRITHLQTRWWQWLIKSPVFPRHRRLHILAALIASFLH